MNWDNLHKLIDTYEERFYEINNSDHDEIFKWRAAKTFRDAWFSESLNKKPFSERFNYAKKDFQNIMDNSFISPSTGVVKLAEKEQETVEKLFTDVLFKEDNNDVVLRQQHIEEFIDGMDKLRQKYYPQSHMYKQDPHAASIYLAFYAPDINYIYRYSEAEHFAQYIEYGKDIGSGKEFRLDYYYEMCDLIVKALKEHKSLLEKHFAFLNEKTLKDESLHLLAFDLMYCSRAYNFFLGLEHISKKESIKAFSEEQAKEKERQEKEEKKNEIKQKIFELEKRAEELSQISLINVEVIHHVYGKGIVVEQEKNHLTIRFGSCEKTFVIHERYIGRPVFEDDEKIIQAMTEYGDICEEMDDLKESLRWI